MALILAALILVSGCILEGKVITGEAGSSDEVLDEDAADTADNGATEAIQEAVPETGQESAEAEEKEVYGIKPSEMIRLIRPEETEHMLGTIFLQGKPHEDLKSIGTYLGTKRKPQVHRLMNYNRWLAPSETLKSPQIDPEDFSVLMLSLLKEYDPSLECYNVGVSGFITTYCKLDDIHYILGYEENLKSWGDAQYEIKDRKIRLSANLIDHLSRCNVVMDYDKEIFVFNEKEFIQFSTFDEFLEWAIAL